MRPGGCSRHGKRVDFIPSEEGRAGRGHDPSSSLRVSSFQSRRWAGPSDPGKGKPGWAGPAAGKPGITVRGGVSKCSAIPTYGGGRAETFAECLPGACRCAFSHLTPRTAMHGKRCGAHVTGERAEAKRSAAGKPESGASSRPPGRGHVSSCPLAVFPSSFSLSFLSSSLPP